MDLEYRGNWPLSYDRHLFRMLNNLPNEYLHNERLVLLLRYQNSLESQTANRYEDASLCSRFSLLTGQWEYIIKLR